MLNNKFQFGSLLVYATGKIFNNHVGIELDVPVCISNSIGCPWYCYYGCRIFQEGCTFTPKGMLQLFPKQKMDLQLLRLAFLDTLKE